MIGKAIKPSFTHVEFKVLVKQSNTNGHWAIDTNGNLLFGLGDSNRGSVSTWRGGLGRKMGGSFKREGTYGYLWLSHVEV